MSGSTSEMLKKASQNIEREYGVRYCTNCASTQPVEGGKWIIYSNGLRRRWKCARCCKTAAMRKLT